MKNPLDDREAGFEAKFKLDQEIEFKIAARRNKLLGLWLGEKLGLNEAELLEYASSIVKADLEEPGQEDIIRKCLLDIKERGANITELELRHKLLEFTRKATEQVENNTG